MVDIEQLKTEIVEKLKPLNIDRVILFGSYAYGTPHQDSDIDLYIVTNDDFMPQSWREKSKIYLKFANELDELMQNIPIDLIVHTQKMYEKFKELNSSFYQHEIQKGQILWQKS